MERVKKKPYISFALRCFQLLYHDFDNGKEEASRLSFDVGPLHSDIVKVMRKFIFVAPQRRTEPLNKLNLVKLRHIRCLYEITNYFQTSSSLAKFHISCFNLLLDVFGFDWSLKKC